MSNLLSKTDATPKRRVSTKTTATSKKSRARKPGSTAARAKTGKRVRPAEPVQEVLVSSSSPSTPGRVDGVKFFLGREGVAFGPYTEFQLRESLRLGIFVRDDLALAEDGMEWTEMSRLFPSGKSLDAQRPSASPASSSEHGEELPLVEVILTLPGFATTKPLPSARRSAAPLSEHHLREHSALFAETPSAALGSRFTDRRFALAAIPAAVVVLCLVLLAAVVRQHEPVPRTDARSAAQTDARRSAPAAPANLAVATEHSGTEKLAANASGVPR